MLYKTFCVPLGSDVFVTIGGPKTTVRLNACVLVNPLASVTCTLKLLAPVAPVGVPEITPEFALRISPVGKLPNVTDHV